MVCIIIISERIWLQHFLQKKGCRLSWQDGIRGLWPVFMLIQMDGMMIFLLSPFLFSILTILLPIYMLVGLPSYSYRKVNVKLKQANKSPTTVKILSGTFICFNWYLLRFIYVLFWMRK